MNLQQKHDFDDIKNTQVVQRLLMCLFSLIPLKFSDSDENDVIAPTIFCRIYKKVRLS